nr:hypothetical protein [Tanacetum cinerariifolium]
MATTIEQQTALDESLVPSSAFQLTADVPEIYMQELWATTKLHHTSIRFKIDSKKSVLNLEAFREMLPTEEEVLDILRFLGHSQDIRYLTDFQILISSNALGTLSQNQHRLCLPDLGGLCVSGGAQESKENEEEKETSEEEEVSEEKENSEKESDDEEEQESRLSEKARIQEEED